MNLKIKKNNISFPTLKISSKGREVDRVSESKINCMGLRMKQEKVRLREKRIYETHICTKFKDFGKRKLIFMIYVFLPCFKRI